MSRRKESEELDVPVILEEPLTSDTCCKLILELVKYLLYQKQQIPVTYEYLIRPGASSAGTSDGCLATARATSKCLQNISENLNSELSRDTAVVKEIVISMGATVISPKFCVRVSLPPGILSGGSHHSRRHSGRKQLLSLMRSMTESREFQEAVRSPLLPTNTFVLVQKSDCHDVSEFFLPKPHYTRSAGTAASRFHLRLYRQDDYTLDCGCANAVRVYQDQDSPLSDVATDRRSAEPKTTGVQLSPRDEAVYRWYQSRDIIRGFKVSRR